MSEFKLAATLRIDVKEAKDLIEEYFRTFPKIKAVLTQLGVFAIKHGYTETLQPFSRKRVFPYWKSVSHEIEAHLSGVKRSYLLGKIERAGKNTPEMYGRVKSGELRECYGLKDSYANPEPSYTGFSSIEGATTRKMSPNNNSFQERPNHYNVLSLKL